MKIVKDGLYMYNDGEDFFIVKADGEYRGAYFHGSVVLPSEGLNRLGFFSKYWYSEQFKRIDNKITHVVSED